VIVVHYGGRAVDVAELRSNLPERVAIIEDAAHAMGASYPDGSLVGSSSNLNCFSFYANKNISTGEGGAVALPDNDKAERIRSLGLHGLSSTAWDRYTDPTALLRTTEIVELGYKMNYTDLQAAIGRVQLRRLGEMSAIRERIANRYIERLDPSRTGIIFQDGCSERSHARHLLVIRVQKNKYAMNRDELLLSLRSLNIGAAIHYKPLHQEPLYSQYSAANGLPNTDLVADEILTLPISASMDLEDVEYVTAQICDLLRLEPVVDDLEVDQPVDPS
jgi:dTDP-4-amino-4,6-dideoxygalactose transaminase